MADKTSRRLRLVFADRGAFHTETITVPAVSLEHHERLIDLLREEPEVTRSLFVDLKRLVSATLVDE